MRNTAAINEIDVKPSDGLRRAKAFHQAGNLVEAEQLYKAILTGQQDRPAALHMLGLIEFARGRSENAVRLIDEALATLPDYVEALIDRGNILCALERLPEALACYDRGLAINPSHASGLYNRGCALQRLGRQEEALASYDRAVAINPNSAEVLNNRGNVLYALKRLPEALESYDRALAVKPDYAEALNNRGAVLNALERREEALKSYDRALAINPKAVEVLYNRGNVLFALKHFEQALESYDRALAIEPKHADALSNRGSALNALRRPGEALESCDRALAIKPDHVDALFNRGNALHDMNRWQAAVASYARVLAIEPDHAAAKFAVCTAELPILYSHDQEITERRAAYERRLMALCDEVDRGGDLRDLAEVVGARQPFYLAYQGYNDRELRTRYGTLICGIMAARYPPAQLPAPPGPDEPIRLGVVSGRFHLHAVWKIAIKGWLTQLDCRRFRIFGYSTGVEEDSETRIAAAACHRFIQGPLSTDRWRQVILADAPHVLIFPGVGMDTVSAVLAAQRLAPVQCSTWGPPATSGFPTLDYFLSSDLMEPLDGDEHYTERLVRLPNLSVYYEPVDVPLVPLGRSELGLRETATVYWCGQSLCKYLPQHDQVFARIAHEAGDCQFVFIEWQKSKYVTDLFKQRLERAFAAVGLRANDYCVILPRMEFAQYCAIFGLCNIYLDSIGWSGGNTTLESLPYGLPIVTMTTPLMRGRHTMAILKMMGITETITETLDDYVSVAVRLARDVPWRMAVKERILANKHKVYRDRACIVALEEFLNRVARGESVAESGPLSP